MGIFEELKPKGWTKIQSSWGRRVVEILEELYGNVRTKLSLSDLRSLSGDIIPSINKYYNLGVLGKEWNVIAGNYGYFQSNVLVQGKPVIKDGDPISVADLGTNAYDKLKTLTESVKDSIDRIYGKIKPINIDEYGRVGVVLFELMPTALQQLYYGTFNVDILATENTVADEIDTSIASSPVTILTPPPNRCIDSRGAYLSTDADSGKVVMRFRDSGKIIAILYADKFKAITMPQIRVPGEVGEPVIVEWSGLTTGAYIFYSLRYKLI